MGDEQIWFGTLPGVNNESAFTVSASDMINGDKIAVKSPTLITTTVPTGATTGKIQVVTPVLAARQRKLRKRAIICSS